MREHEMRTILDHERSSQMESGRDFNHISFGPSVSATYFHPLPLPAAPFDDSLPPSPLLQPLSITLRGITNDPGDPGIDVFRTVTLPLLKRLGVEDGLELRVVKR